MLSHESQMYIIAKVGRGTQRRYRCVAAFHWQHADVHENTVRMIVRFINALQHPINARLVQADLETFDNYETKMPLRPETESPLTGNECLWPCSCPYVNTLCFHATGIRVDDGYLSESSFLPPDMRPSEGGRL